MDATTWNRRLSACIGKEPFSTPQIANKVLRRSQRKRSASRSRNHTYRCEHCGFFHIGPDRKSVHARRQRDHEGDDQA